LNSRSRDKVQIARRLRQPTVRFIATTRGAAVLEFSTWVFVFAITLAVLLIILAAFVLWDVLAHNASGSINSRGMSILPGVLNANSFGACSVPVGKTSNLPTREKAAEMTVSELIDQLSAMPPDATVMLWSRMDDPQHRRLESVELSTTKSDPYAEVVVLS
jgi:hypothetical protein